jgi:hypothetical protein
MLARGLVSGVIVHFPFHFILILIIYIANWFANAFLTFVLIRPLTSYIWSFFKLAVWWSSVFVQSSQTPNPPTAAAFRPSNALHQLDCKWRLINYTTWLKGCLATGWGLDASISEKRKRHALCNNQPFLPLLISTILHMANGSCVLWYFVILYLCNCKLICWYPILNLDRSKMKDA